MMAKSVFTQSQVGFEMWIWSKENIVHFSSCWYHHTCANVPEYTCPNKTSEFETKKFEPFQDIAHQNYDRLMRDNSIFFDKLDYQSTRPYSSTVSDRKKGKYSNKIVFAFNFLIFDPDSKASNLNWKI